MPKLIKTSLSASFFKKKYFIFILIVLAAFLTGLSIAKFLPDNKNIDKPDIITQSALGLPQDKSIGGYIQTQTLDFDNDKSPELIAIYYDQGDEFRLYKIFFAVFKQKGQEWQKLFQQELEEVSLFEETGSPLEKGKLYNSFQIVNLRGANSQDILVKTRAEGSGGFMGIFIFGMLTKGQVRQLFVKGPIPKGEAGVDGNKVWLMEPIYGPDDPNCCPSLWKKGWWQYQTNEFVLMKTLEKKDYDTLLKTSYSASQITNPPKPALKPASENEQILAVARQYAQAHSVPNLKFSLKITKRVGNYALVQVEPEGGSAEGAAVILEKIGNRWQAQEMGTTFPEWEAKVPKLFEW